MLNIRNSRWGSRKRLFNLPFLSQKLNTEEKRFSQQELQNYYNEHQENYCTDGLLGFSLIEIHPDELDAAQFLENETAEVAAQRLATGVVEQLRNGGDFAESAKAFHGGEIAEKAGGEIEPFTPGIKSMLEPYNSLEPYAIQLEQGAISEPVITPQVSPCRPTPPAKPNAMSGTRSSSMPKASHPAIRIDSPHVRLPGMKCSYAFSASFSASISHCAVFSEAHPVPGGTNEPAANVKPSAHLSRNSRLFIGCLRSE